MKNKFNYSIRTQITRGPKLKFMIKVKEIKAIVPLVVSTSQLTTYCFISTTEVKGVSLSPN